MDYATTIRLTQLGETGLAGFGHFYGMAGTCFGKTSFTCVDTLTGLLSTRSLGVLVFPLFSVYCFLAAQPRGSLLPLQTMRCCVKAIVPLLCLHMLKVDSAHALSDVPTREHTTLFLWVQCSHAVPTSERTCGEQPSSVPNSGAPQINV